MRLGQAGVVLAEIKHPPPVVVLSGEVGGDEQLVQAGAGAVEGAEDHAPTLLNDRIGLRVQVHRAVLAVARAQLLAAKRASGWHSKMW